MGIAATKMEVTVSLIRFRILIFPVSIKQYRTIPLQT